MARLTILLVTLGAAAGVAQPTVAKEKKQPRVSVSDISVNKPLDSASPRKKGAQQFNLLKIDMHKVTVSSRQSSPSGGPQTTTPLSATSSGLLAGGGAAGGASATHVRHTAPTGPPAH